MATVITHAVVSVDGFIADEHDDVGPLFEWYFNGDQPITGTAGEERHDPFRISSRSVDYVRSMWGSIGATIQGRRLFDLTNGWEAEPPAGDHLIVVSSRPKPDGWHPEADVPFFDDVTAAVEEAKRRAGDRVVAVCAGHVGGQALALGLVDEVAMDVVPVVFGRGKRYFGPIEGQHLLEDPYVVIQGDRVLHLRYRVRPPA
ncbi:dihydrofolate reductase [Nocardioides sp. MAH-18]|uniref:Dihydrofolate reductase n=1 Tax=Nocardioides agri TaxID=2682843 RepID=A0A6L6XPC3_9ACTN|nr:MULTISPECIES: dihydrofolate reductase family protein [unclassified Nocardioides]MBA2954108.1 dihydrofolate reductase family protein [Nocardioides sp. CGMCC 1.13656]MVQ48970.1 dihydrofolate reductase [Nocardioides sp. MAH-18]